jgi:hypothetical protein
MIGIKALTESLGSVGAERFIALIQREPFDYTKWQRTLWEGQSVEEVSRNAMRIYETVAERIRIDRESEAIHDLILSLDEPVGIRRDLYICKYFLGDVGRLQAG